MARSATKGRFKGCVVWVTGASSGIGEATAIALAREGARLVISARRRAELERVAAVCRAEGAAEVHVAPLDLAEVDALAGVARGVMDAVGPIDVIVHAGGISQRARAIESSIAVDRRLMEVNYFGTVALTRALLPSMVARRRGHFVVITSLTGVVGSPMRSSYAASKHALHGFFDSLRAEHHRDGIAVTLVCPGFVRTSVSINALRGDGTPQGTMDRATARGISPEACAKAIVEATLAREVEVYVGGMERIGPYIERLSPKLLSILLRWAKVT